MGLAKLEFALHFKVLAKSRHQKGLPELRVESLPGVTPHGGPSAPLSCVLIPRTVSVLYLGLYLSQLPATLHQLRLLKSRQVHVETRIQCWV